MDHLLVGQIGKPHGVAGAVYVHAYNEDSPFWLLGESLTLIPSADVPDPKADVLDVSGERTVSIEGLGRGAKGRVVLHLAGVRGRAAAEALRGAYLAVPTARLKDVADDEFYLHEVQGWDVTLSDGTSVGRVVRAVETHVIMLEVRPSRGGATFFVPVVPEIVTDIGRAARRFVIDPPEGLVP